MYSLGKVVLEEITPVHMIGLIFSVSVLPLAGWSIANGEWRQFRNCTRRDWLYIIAFSLTSIAALLAMWTGIEHLDPTVASFIGRLQTLVAVFLGILFLRERFHLSEFVGGLIVIVGIVIIRISFDVSLSLWFWVMVVSAFFFGVTEVYAKLSVRSLAPVPLNLVRNGIIAIFFLVWTWFSEASIFNLGRLWPYIIALSLGGPVGSRLCFLFALKYIDVSKAVLVNQMQPLFVSAIAFTFIGTIPTLQEWIGGVLVLGGCVVLMGWRGKVISR